MSTVPGTAAEASVASSAPFDRAGSTEGLSLHTLASVDEPIDPRISPEDRADAIEVDESLAAQLFSRHRHQVAPEILPKAPPGLSASSGTVAALPYDAEDAGDLKSEKADVLYVEFKPGDPRNPAEWSKPRKWLITCTACFFTVLSAATGSTYAQGFPSMTKDLHCTTFQAAIGLSTYCLGFGVVPLVTASLSEEFGRQPLYIVCAVGFALMHAMVGAAQNIQTVIIGRLLAGAFGSTGATMVGGTVADIWLPAERGLPMSIYAISAIGATGIGPVAAGWIEMNPHLGWRWIQWFHLIAAGIYIFAILLFLRETRSAVLLTRMAKKIRKETSDSRYRARAEDERGRLRTLIYISCTRPLYLLLTEPVVISFSLWVGLAWGILYSMIESISPIFKTLHNFNQGETGTVFLGMVVGSLLGFATNLYQEKLYRKYVPTKGPEARLLAACGAALLFPTGMFIYAWTSFSDVPWIAPVIGIVVFMWATFIIYLAVFTYLADCYGLYASSSLAGQSLFRNLMGTAFPLFTNQMYTALSYKWASTIFGAIAVVMIPIPFVLLFYGPVIRAKSKFASQIMHR